MIGLHKKNAENEMARKHDRFVSVGSRIWTIWTSSGRTWCPSWGANVDFFSPSILKRMPVLLTKYELRLYYNGVGKRRARIRRVADDSVSNQHWIPIRPTLKIGRHFGFINGVMVLKKKFDQFSGFSCINQDNRDFRTTSLTVNVILNSQVSLKTQTPRHKSK